MSYGSFVASGWRSLPLDPVLDQAAGFITAPWMTTPWQSGGIRHEQGVSKAGNPRLRTTLIQIAWLWIRHQPQSALTRWFKERSPHGRKRAIVALARKLLVALWKYVTQGVVIEGAVMKPVA